MFIVLPSLARPICLVKTVLTAHISLLGKDNLGFVNAKALKVNVQNFNTIVN